MISASNMYRMPTSASNPSSYYRLQVPIKVYYKGVPKLLQEMRSCWGQKDLAFLLNTEGAPVHIVYLEDVMMLDPNNPVEKLLYGA